MYKLKVKTYPSSFRVKVACHIYWIGKQRNLLYMLKMVQLDINEAYKLCLGRKRIKKKLNLFNPMTTHIKINFTQNPTKLSSYFLASRM